MAKRSKVNKSQMIRDALAANPSKGPTEIAEILKGQGLVVKAAYVSAIKGNAKKARRRARALTIRGTARRTVGRRPARSPSLDIFPATLEFIRAAGGLEGAKSALATIAGIQDVL